jgi:hypothetical protein
MLCGSVDGPVLQEDVPWRNALVPSVAMYDTSSFGLFYDSPRSFSAQPVASP